MSSFTELYITEDIADTFANQLTKHFGDNWQLDGLALSDAEVNRVMTIDVMDTDNDFKKVGEIVVENKPDIIGDMLGDDVLGWSPKRLLKIKKGKKIVFKAKG